MRTTVVCLVLKPVGRMSTQLNINRVHETIKIQSPRDYKRVTHEVVTAIAYSLRTIKLKSLRTIKR